MSRNIESIFGAVVTAPHQIPFTYTATGGEQSISLPFFPLTGFITINGGVQVPVDNYEIDGNTIHLGRELEALDVVYCLFDKIISPDDQDKGVRIYKFQAVGGETQFTPDFTSYGVQALFIDGKYKVPEEDYIYSKTTGKVTLTSPLVAGVWVAAEMTVKQNIPAFSGNNGAGMIGTTEGVSVQQLFDERTPSFQSGGTLRKANEFIIDKSTNPQQLYVWNGTFPKVVPANSTPAGTGGTAGWSVVGDAVLREELVTVVKTVLSMKKMLALTPADGKTVKTLSFHEGLGYGGGVYVYSANKPGTEHNGGSVISAQAVFPTDWNDQTKVQEWFYPTVPLTTGCWVRQDNDIHNILNYGARNDSSMLINILLNNMADKSIAIYLPRGKYKVENFVRNIPAGGNINMTSMIIYGEPTYGCTDQNYSWETVSVIQGSGDLFKQTVNTAIRDVYIRNTPGSTFGKLFTLGAYAQCEIAGCVFGPCNYHIYNPDTGFDGYNVKPFFRNCRFYGAEVQSRYLAGTVANYHEADCYTSHNKKGLYLAAPVTCAITDSIFEYNDDGAIEVDAFGYNVIYDIQLSNVFFETNNAGPVTNYKTRSGPHITLRTVKNSQTGEPDLGGAILNVNLQNLRFVDVTDKNPAFGCIYVDSKTVNIVEQACSIEPDIASRTKLVTGSLDQWTDFTKNYADTRNTFTSLGGTALFNSIASPANDMFNKGRDLNSLQMGMYGHISKLETVLANGSTSLIVTKVGGAVLNGELYVTSSNGSGFTAYRYRVVGTSSNHTLTLIDGPIGGGPGVNVSTANDPVNFIFYAQSTAGAATNLTMAYHGIVV